MQDNVQHEIRNRCSIEFGEIIWKVALIAILVFLTLMIQGCIVAAVGAGYGMARHAQGDLKTTEGARTDVVYAAAVHALEQMELEIVEDKHDAMTASILARDAEGKKIVVKIEGLRDSSTKLFIRVGTFGDRTKSQLIYKQIKAELARPVVRSNLSPSPPQSLTRRQENKPQNLPPPLSSSVWMPGTYRRLWVLAIGVGQYERPEVPPLPYARSDAVRICDWFTGLDVDGMTKDNVHVLLDEQAKRENILAQINWLRTHAMPDDVIFVYFAGHGAPELASDGSGIDAKYLILNDTNPQDLFVTGLPLDELMLRLDSIEAKIQVLILEACYTGPIGQKVLEKTPAADLEVRPRLIQKMGQKSGRVILSASSGRQIAIGSEEIHGGLFTHYLLAAWGDGSQRLLSNQFQYVRDQVRRASKRLGSRQEPVKYGDQNVDIILKSK